MKILVTGAGGFLGKRLARHLADAGHEVTATVRTEPAGADRAYFESPRVNVLRFDLARFDGGGLPRGIDAVYSLAQSSNFRNFPERADDIFAVNVSANAALLAWAVAHKVERFVYASSGGIYGARSGPSHESDLLAVNSPLGFYLGSKLCAEVLLQNYRQFFRTAVILRPFFIYGPNQKKDMLVARLIDSVCEGRPIQLQGADGLRLNPVFVEDAMRAFAGALELDGVHVMNVAGPDVLTLREVGETIGRLAGRKPVFENAPGSPVDYVASTDGATSKLGLKLTRFADGLKATLDAQRG
jgi:UDP-glucose 4-epimerase